MDVKIVGSIDGKDIVEAVIDFRAHRRVFPAGKVQDGTLSKSEFEAGIEYGIPFDEIVPVNTDMVGMFGDALHNAGVWTLEDLHTKSRQAIGALQAVYAVELARIIQAVEAYQPGKPAPKQATQKTTRKEQ
jgi:hypothetical protein